MPWVKMSLSGVVGEACLFLVVTAAGAAAAFFAGLG